MRGRFLTPLITEHRGAECKQLREDLVYEDAVGRRYRVPAGFPCDGASVPRLLWMFFPPFGENYEAAAWLHDFLYQHAEAIDVDGRPITRAEADGLMRAAARATGYNALGAWALYLGVRAGGWCPWRRYRAAAEAQAA